MNNLSLGRLGRAINANTDTTSQTSLGANGLGSIGTEVALSDFTFDDMGASIDIYATIFTHEGGGLSGSGVEPSLDVLLSDNGFTLCALTNNLCNNIKSNIVPLCANK